jgi:hypothetical protein
VFVTPILLQKIVLGISLLSITRAAAVSKTWKVACMHALKSMPSLVVVREQFVRAFRFATRDWHDCLPEPCEVFGGTPGDLWVGAEEQVSLPPSNRNGRDPGWPRYRHACCKLGDGSLYMHSEQSTIRQESSDAVESWDCISRPVVFDPIKNVWRILPSLQWPRFNYQVELASLLDRDGCRPVVCALGDKQQIFVTYSHSSTDEEQYYIYDLESRAPLTAVDEAAFAQSGVHRRWKTPVTINSNAMPVSSGEALTVGFAAHFPGTGV